MKKNYIWFIEKIELDTHDFNARKDASNKILNLTLGVLRPDGESNHHLQNSQGCACQET